MSPSSSVSIFLAFLLSFLTFLTTTNGLGINCRGSMMCPSEVSVSLAGLFASWTETATWSTANSGFLESDDYYAPGAHIACIQTSIFGGGVCLFAQGRGLPLEGVNGSTVYIKMVQLMEHGCKTCGSVPISQDNDPDKEGVLTLNYVDSLGNCQGLCWPPTTPGEHGGHGPGSSWGNQGTFNANAALSGTGWNASESASLIALAASQTASPIASMKPS